MTDNNIDKNNNNINTAVALDELDSLLQCPICYDYLNIPVSLSSCQHSFCSECIRSSFKAQMKLYTKSQKQECPVCRAPASGDDNSNSSNKIVPNLLVGRIVKKFLDIQQKLKLHNEDDGVNSTTTTTTPTTTTRSLVPKAEQQKPKQTQLRRRVATRYYGLKRKQLQGLCENEGLSTCGNEEELKQRHAEFCLLVNAECDAEFPRTEVALRLELEKREIERRRISSLEYRRCIAATSDHIENLKLARKKAGEENHLDVPIKSGNPKFDKKFHDNFQKLISEAARKKNNLKRKFDNDNALTNNNSNNTPEHDIINHLKANSTTTSPCENEIIVQNTSTTSDAAVVTSSTTKVNSQQQLLLSRNDVDNNNEKISNIEPPSIISGGVSGNLNKSPCDSTKETAIYLSSSSSSRSSFVHATTSSSLLRINKAINKRHNMSISPNGGSKKINTLLSSPIAERSIIGPWQCPVCTFINSDRNWTKASCGMCGQGQRVL